MVLDGKDAIVTGSGRGLGLAYAVEAVTAAEAMPSFFRHDLGFGTSEDVAGLVAYLASDAAADVTGQAIGVGGDRLQLWSHPEPVVTAYHEGGGVASRSNLISALRSVQNCSPSESRSHRCRKTSSVRHPRPERSIR